MWHRVASVCLIVALSLISGGTAEKTHLTGSQQHIIDHQTALLEGVVEVARASQVVHFSIQNLFTLTLIGFFVIGVAFFGFGGLTGRSLEYDSWYNPARWMDSSDALYVLAFMLGEDQGSSRQPMDFIKDKSFWGKKKSYGCLNRLACLDDKRAYDVLTASKMVMKGVKYLKPIFGTYLGKQDLIIEDFHEAIEFKRNGGNCREKYQCKQMPSM